MISGREYYKYWTVTRHEIFALIWSIPVYICPALSETSIFNKWRLAVYHNY